MRSCMVSSHRGWSHAFSQSAVSSSATHHELSASILTFDLIFFVISFITFNLCCLLISTSSVDSSCLLCRRCRLYFLNKAKILAQQSSLHLSSYTGAFASVSLCFAVLDLVFVTNLLLHSFSQILPALIHSVLTHTSPFYRFFCVFFKRAAQLSLSSLLCGDHPITFSFSFVHFAPLPCHMRSCTTNSSTFCMASAYKELPSILLRSRLSSSFSSSAHCTSIWSFFCQSPSSSSSSFSICEQSQLCLTLCPTVLCAVDLASSCTPAFSLIPATTSRAISHITFSLCCFHLPPLLLYLSLWHSFLATFLRCNPWAPSATSAHSISVSPFLFEQQKSPLSQTVNFGRD